MEVMEREASLNPQMLRAYIYAKGYTMAGYCQASGVSKRTMEKHLKEGEPFRNGARLSKMLRALDLKSIQEVRKALDTALWCIEKPKPTKKGKKPLLDFLIAQSGKTLEEVASEAGIDAKALSELANGVRNERQALEAVKVYKATSPGKEINPAIFYYVFFDYADEPTKEGNKA